MGRPYSISSLLGGLWFFAIALASGGISGDADAADAAIPVQFAGGASSATVSGKVSDHGEVTYSLVAEAGQTMAIHLDSGYAAPMGVSVRGVFDLKRNSTGSTQLWTGTIRKTGTVDIVIHGGGPVPSLPVDPSQFNMTITIIGSAAARVDRLEQVDFANSTVATQAGSADQLKDGSGSPDAKLSAIYKGFHVFARPPIFGNIDGYSGELAEVSVDSMYGGTGQFRTVDLFGLEDGIPVFVAILPGGDRGDGGFGKVQFAGGHLVVDVWGSPSTSGACCPTFVDPVCYRFVAGKLVSDGKEPRRKFQSSEEH